MIFSFRAVAAFLSFTMVVGGLSCRGKDSVPLERITIAYPLSMYSVLYQIAYTNAYFRAEGLEVIPQAHEFGKPAVNAMIEGKADLAISGDTVIMFAIADGNKICIIAQNLTSKKNEAIVARKDRGIESPRHLEGRSIGVALGTTGHFFLDSFLTVNGIDKRTVRMIDMPPGKMSDSLVQGAVDAISGVGRVTIETSNAVFDEDYCKKHEGSVLGEYVLLTVSDSGVGMTRDIMEHLFDPFFTTKELGKGTGLGLATVYGIMKQNDGFINAYSEPGQGTTFRLYFPRCEGDSVIVREKTAEILSTGNETVLIAEDELPLLNIAKTILTKQGYTVLAARTPAEALSLAQEHKGEIHLLLTDVVMPEMNGRELQEKLHARRPEMKSIFMSGYTADVVAHRGVLDGGVHFIEKPFSPRVLAEKVREVLDDARSYPGFRDSGS